MPVRTLAWRCWVRGCGKTRETQAALEKHFFKDHRAYALKRLFPKGVPEWFLMEASQPKVRKTKAKAAGGK